MKASRLSYATWVVFFLARPTTACLRSEGTIIADPIMGWTIGMSLTDNGVAVSQGGGAHQDEAGDWNLDCDGCTLKIGKMGGKATYTNAGQTYQWLQPVTRELQDCYGACEDRKGACIKCTTYSWDINQYC